MSSDGLADFLAREAGLQGRRYRFCHIAVTVAQTGPDKWLPDRLCSAVFGSGWWRGQVAVDYKPMEVSTRKWLRRRMLSWFRRAEGALVQTFFQAY